MSEEMQGDSYTGLRNGREGEGGREREREKVPVGLSSMAAN